MVPRRVLSTTPAPRSRCFPPSNGSLRHAVFFRSQSFLLEEWGQPNTEKNTPSASAGAVLSLMMQHESALTVRAARAGGMPFPTWEFDDEGDSEDGESAGSDEVDSDDSDLGGMSHDGDHVQ